MTAAADRHLLFGLLALQNGLIDQGQLILAFQAWIRDKSKSLADQLVARGDLDADARAGLDAIVALHVKKHGDVEKSLAAVPAGKFDPRKSGQARRPGYRGDAQSRGLRARLDRRGRFRPHSLLLRRRVDQRRPAVPHPPAARPGRAGGGVRGAG